MNKADPAITVAQLQKAAAKLPDPLTTSLDRCEIPVPLATQVPWPDEHIRVGDPFETLVFRRNRFVDQDGRPYKAWTYEGPVIVKESR